VIGILLIAVAALLARRCKSLLLEESAPADVLEPIRERVNRAGWVGELTELHAVYVGPSDLLINLWITPSPAGLDATAGELVEHVGRLRGDLMADPVVAQVTVTLTDGG
jgi:hypothetical protein